LFGDTFREEWLLLFVERVAQVAAADQEIKPLPANFAKGGLAE